MSLNGGTTWINNSATLWIKPNRQASIMTRTLLTVTTGQTQGWSFSLEYDNASQTQYGGTMSATAVTTSGTQTMTVQNGGPPDMNATAIRSGYKGYTQGIVVDTNEGYTLPPTSNFVTSKACFSITSGSTYSSYPIYLKFTHAIGDPTIFTVVTQNGLSIVPCAQNFTLTVNVNPSVSIAGGCTISGGGGPLGPAGGGGQGAFTCPPEFGPGPLTHFVRGEANQSGGAPDITDAIFVLNFLFLAGPVPPCRKAADTNDDNQIDISDGVFLLNFLFLGGMQLPPPGLTCGPDPTAPAELGCVASICDPDTDGDGFPDALENGERLIDGLNLSDLSADPERPDIFVEVDWFELQGDHSHRPLLGALQNVANAFALAPVETRDENGQVVSMGITLHVDAGVVGQVNLPGVPLQGGPIVFTDPALERDFAPGVTTADLQPIWTRLANQKAQSFSASRRNVFRYSLWVHEIDTNAFSIFRFVNGLSKGNFTDDFMVALGVDQLLPDVTKQGVIFMHELGHTLNLRHGGSLCGADAPHYRSVMSRRYMDDGVDLDCNGTPDGVLDYSDEVLDSLAENCLDETRGICVVDGQSVGPAAPAFTPTDFDLPANGIQPPCTQRDLTFDGDTSDVVPGWNDWNGTAFRYDFQSSPFIAAPPQDDLATCADCTQAEGQGAGGGSGPEGFLCIPLGP